MNFERESPLAVFAQRSVKSGPKVLPGDAILTDERRRLLETWKADQTGWSFLTGRDTPTEDWPDGRPIYWTRDEQEKDKTRGLKPFPAHPYVQWWLEILGDTVPERDVIFCEKSRRMFLSTSTLGYAQWLCGFYDSQRVMLSKSKQDEAEQMYTDKVRVSYLAMPAWLRRELRLAPKPKGKLNYRNVGDVPTSYMQAVAQNVAVSEARGGGASLFVFDEAAFQEMAEDIYSGAMPMVRKFVAITSPNADLGGRAFKSYAHVAGVEEKPQEVRPGFEVKVTERNHTVVKIHYTADEAKRSGPGLAKMRADQPDEARFRREYEIDWSIRSGDAYYQVISTNPKRFIRRAPGLIRNRPVIRGWDFGGRHPACVWMQVDPNYRVWILRELMAGDCDTYQFRDVVMYLSGQMPYDTLVQRRHEKALAIVENIRTGRTAYHMDLPEYARQTPWFEDGHYQDWTGHEGNISSGLVKAGEARTPCEILEAEGLAVQPRYVGVEGREDVLRGLLLTRQDGNPGLLLDPACPILIEAFSGGITYELGKKHVEVPDGIAASRDVPAKHPWFSHLHEAAGYGIVNTVPVALTHVVESADMDQRGEYTREEPRRAFSGFQFSENS